MERGQGDEKVNPGAAAPQASDPYTVLAAGYDVVMGHVEYDAWAEYIYELLEQYHSEAQLILELGCGTGSLALELQPLGPYQYVATDRSPQMIHVARSKAEMQNAPIQFEVVDFTNFRVDAPADVILLLYDGLNYLLEDDGVRALLRCTHAALKPGGVFIVDQSTPANSINNEAYFEDRGEADIFSYVRHSSYDRTTRLHTTVLDMSVGDQHFREQHVQRAYELSEVRVMAEEAGFEVVAAYDSFTTDAATDASERVHWVLRRK